MRILQLVGPSTGGIGAHVDRLTADLRALGHEVVLVTAHVTAERFDWPEADRLWPLGRGWSLARAPLDWHRIMRRAGTVDIVHAHGHQAALVAAVAVLRARPRPRLVVTLHNELPDRRPGAQLVGWALRRADLTTGASGDLVELARRLGSRRVELTPIPAPRLTELLATPVPTGPERRAERRRLLSSLPDREDPAAGEPDAPLEDRPLVLTVGRIAPQKDLGVLAEAAGRSESDATWVLVGGGDPRLRAALASRLSGIPLRLVGARTDVPAWLRAATVFVLTSRWEARALVVQEAMAAGLPVVVPAGGGLPDLVGDAGILVPPGDPASTAAAVDALLREPERAAALGAAGRARARTWASAPAEARRWVARYRELTRG